MNKSKPNSKSKYLYIGMIFYVLIFFSGVVFIGHVLSAKAAPSSSLAPFDISPTPTDTTTPTTQPTITPTPTTSPATATPAPTTPAAQPTTPAAQPTIPTTQPTTPPVMLPPGPGPTNNPGVTATPTATATATPTAVTKPSATTPTSLTQNTATTPPSKPDTGGDTGGPSMLGLSLGIGTPVLLLFGGGLFWLYLRKRQQGVTGLQFGSPANSPWISSNDMATNNNFSPVSGSFTPNSATGPSPYTTNPLLASNASVTSVANTLQQATLPPFAELAGPLYTPSDLRPITMALPQPFPNQAVPGATSYPPTSDMNPLSFEALNLPQNIAEMMAPQQRPNIAEMLISQQTPAIPISTMAMNDHLANSIQNSPTPAVAVLPPDPASNAVLENVMRQAQLGLFVIPNR